MIRNRATGLYSAVILLFGGVAAFGQGNVAPAPSAPANPGTVALNVVVTPKKGAPVTGLNEQDFKLLDNNVPVPITSFRAIAGKQAPVEVVLVVDAVNVPYTGVAYMRGQIEKFLRADDGQLAFPTSLVIFTDTGAQVQPGFSRDGNAEATSLDHASIGLRDVNRSAGFWGATERVQKSIDMLQQLTVREASVPGRKFIVWVSPGWPLLSGPAIQLSSNQERGIFTEVVQLSAELRRANVTLYNVNPIGAAEGPGRTFYFQEFVKGVSQPTQVEPADLSLQVVATQSGGLVLTSSNDLARELQDCYADGMAYYEIHFDPAHAEKPDQYHSVNVKVDQPGLTPRTLQGYYAQP